MSFVLDKEQVEMLKASKEVVGYLQPVIREKGTDKILVGRHRKMADPDWPEIEMEIESDTQRELVIIHGNVQRGISEVEAKMRVDRIARALISLLKIEPHKICSYIVENKLLPWKQRRIEQLLSADYKMKTIPKTKSRTNATSPTPQVLVPSKKMLTALDQQTAMNMPAYPFKDCKCKECPNKTKCY